jgi:putative ABC transport system permease protein
MWIEDLRNAFRCLRSAPGFTVTAVLSLSIGIAGSVSMFTLVNSVLLKPLAYPDSGKLVRVTNSYAAAYASTRTDTPGLLALQFTRWRKQVRSLESIALTKYGCECNLTGTGRAERLSVVDYIRGLLRYLEGAASTWEMVSRSGRTEGIAKSRDPR